MSYRSALLSFVFCSALTWAMLGCGDSETPEYAVCPIPLGDAPTRGSSEAWVTIVEFADFECPYCQRAQATLKEVDEERPGLRWAFKHFPLESIHSHAVGAASAADCAGKQGKFWEMYDVLFAESGKSLDDNSLREYASTLGLDTSKFDECLHSDASLQRIGADFLQGLAFGVDGTPQYFINGRVLRGAYSTKDILKVIDTAQKEAKASGVARKDYYRTLEERGCY